MCMLQGKESFRVIVLHLSAFGKDKDHIDTCEAEFKSMFILQRSSVE